MAINLEVKSRRGETTERLIKRFLKKVKKERIIETYRDRMRFIKPSEKKRMQIKRSQRKREFEKLKEENSNG